MTSLANPKGISSRTVIDVPDAWSAEWFRQFIRTQLGNVDIRNATAGLGIVITGTATTPATVSVSSDLQALFHQPYVLATAPAGISSAFNAYRLLAPQAGVLTVTDSGARTAITVGVAANGIGNAQLRKGSPLSVIGNATSATANVSDIASTSNGDVLWNNGGTALSFGPLTTLGTVTIGTWNATPVAAPYGGTGQNTYVVGDLLYASAANALARLADVASGSFLRSGGVGVAPGWSATTYPNSATQGDILYAAGANTYANLADVAAGSYLRSGGVGAAPVWSAVTLPNAAALGDLMYASAANAYSDLAGNTTATKKFLTQTGTGSVSAAPGWGTIATGDLGAGSADTTKFLRGDLSWTNALTNGLTLSTASDNQLLLNAAGGGRYTSVYFQNNGTSKGQLVYDNSVGPTLFITTLVANAQIILGGGIAGTAITIDGSQNVKVSGNIGFNGTAAIAKPSVTGSRGGNAALASFLTALANYGLITDSTTV